jgi:hypothetical protein
VSVRKAYWQMAESTKLTSVGAPKKRLERITNALVDLAGHVPSSKETARSTPRDRARALALTASSHAATVSGTLALLPGPLGIITILPDLRTIWKIQRQLVSDIAAAYGKTAQLGRAQMIYCLFKHAASQAVRDLVVRVGERVLVRRATLRVIRRILRRVGVAVTRRVAGRAVARWLPLVGAVGIGAYAFYDTAQVGKTAMAFFEKEIVFEGEGSR